VPKPKKAKNEEQLSVKDPKKLFKSSPMKDEFAKLQQNHEMYADEVKRMK